MSVIQTALALLAALAKLLSFLTANPDLPADVRENAIVLSQQAILAASQTLGQVRNGAPEYVVLSKPIYDLYSLERSINAAINIERTKAGLAALALNDDLSRIARRHSEDQASTNRLTTDIRKPCAYPMIRHEGLTAAGFDLGERLDSASVRFRRAAENIALVSSAKNFIYRAATDFACPDFNLAPVPEGAAESVKIATVRANITTAAATLAQVPTVEWVNREWQDMDTLTRRAVTGWIESEGHRVNILNANYTETGIGIAEANEYVVITQIFLQPR